MKHLTHIAVNYGKILKSSPEDQNEEVVYAEVNILLSEPDYTLTNEGLRRGHKLTEVEIGLSKATAKKMLTALRKIHAKIVELEKSNLCH